MRSEMMVDGLELGRKGSPEPGGHKEQPVKKCIHQENRIECRVLSKQQEANRTKDRKESNLISSFINRSQSKGSYFWPRICSIQREGLKWLMEAMLVDAGGV